MAYFSNFTKHPVTGNIGEGNFMQMNNKIILFLAILCTSLTSVKAQIEPWIKNASNLPLLANLPTAIKVHIPEGYQVLDTAFGNLNFDSFPDLIMVLKSPKEDTTFDSAYTVRPLLILYGNKNGSYTLAFKNNSVVRCISCGGLMGDPFEGIAIKNGSFSVEHYGGSSVRWSEETTFTFNKKKGRFYLHKQRIISYHIYKPSKITTTVKRVNDFGTVDFEQYNKTLY